MIKWLQNFILRWAMPFMQPSARSPVAFLLTFAMLLISTPTHAQVPHDTSGAWFEDVTHKAGIRYRHHPRQFSNPYAAIMQGYAQTSES